MERKDKKEISEAEVDLNWAWLPFAAAMLPDFPMLYWSPALYGSPSSSIKRAYARLLTKNRIKQWDLPAVQQGDPGISPPTLLNSSRVNAFPDDPDTSSIIGLNYGQEQSYLQLDSPGTRSCSVVTESFLFSKNYDNLRNGSLVSETTTHNETFETIDLNENDDCVVKIVTTEDTKVIVKNATVSSRSNFHEDGSIPDETSSIYGTNYSPSFISRSLENVRGKRILIGVVITAISVAIAVIILTAWLVH